MQWVSSASRVGRPVLLRPALTIALITLVPAVLAVTATALVWLVVAVDLLLLLLVCLDVALSPRPSALRARRVVESVLSSGIANRVRFELETTEAHNRMISLEFRDTVGSGPLVDGHVGSLRFQGAAFHEWRLTPLTRGDLKFGALHVRVAGPLGFCARQFSLPLEMGVRVFPDLTALSHDALSLARTAQAQAKRIIKVRAEGREFESLREFRRGDDRRTIDWKATARRSKPMVRVHQPERNQVVLLLIDCGRHMAGEVLGRRKLDLAVDAALRVARVSLDQGDLVGVLAFGAEVKAWLPPRKGVEQLKAMTRALYSVEASLDESDYGKALDLAFSRGVRRSLVLLMTDVIDVDSSAALLKRTARLVPRHLPLVVSFQDAAIHELSLSEPITDRDAYRRLTAVQLENDVKKTVARLRDAGAQVVRSPAEQFGASAVSAYLQIKSRGLL